MSDHTIDDVTHENGVVILWRDHKAVAKLSPGVAFNLAEQLSEKAYAALGLPERDEDARDRIRTSRKHASWFEQLYCQIRDIADDWHRESVRRYEGREPGLYQKDFLVPDTAVIRTGQVVVQTIRDWDY